MKFNFHTIVFDLETTDVEPREIIEIGATFLDKELKIQGHFQSLVKCQQNISEFVTKLTGHTTEKIHNSKSFAFVSQNFEDWAKTLSGNIKNCRLAAWGNYFDVNLLRDHYSKRNNKGTGYPYLDNNFPFSGTCIDVKTVGLCYCYLAGKRTDSLSVAKMAEYLNITGNGQYHRADYDAFITAKIYVEALNRIQNGVWIDGKYIKIGV